MEPASTTPEGVEALWQRLWPRSRFVEPLELRRAPLLAAALWFALGIAASRWWQPAGLLIAALLFGFTAIVLLRRSPRIALLATAGMWLLLGWWCAKTQPTPAQSMELLHYADGLSREVHGRVVRIHPLPSRNDLEETPQDASEWEAPGRTAMATVDLELDAVEEVTPDVSRMMPVHGGVRITVFDDMPSLSCGDVVSVPLRLREPERYRDPGAWQYADYLLEQGVVAHAAAHADVLRSSGNAGAPFSCRIVAAQSWAAARLLRYAGSSANRHSPHGLRLTGEDAGMLNAMLFGDRTRLVQPLRVGFERTGSFHLFVVSGLHVALLAGGLWWLFGRLRVGEIPATFLTLALTGGYALLTGFGVPVQRALAMAAVVLIARLLSRERSVLNGLGAAALLVLAWSPRALFEASFQMTFLTIVAVSIAVPLGEWSFLPWARATRKIDAVWIDASLTPRLAQFRVTLRMLGEPLDSILWRGAGAIPAAIARVTFWLAELALIGLVMECCMALPMAMYFHRATVFALPANMLSIPLVAVIAPLALLTFLCSLAGSWLALVPGWLTALLLHGVTSVIARISNTRAADWRLPGPSLSVALCAAATLALCCWMVRRSARWSIAGALVLLLVPLLALCPERATIHPGILEVTALDVGQGDSLLVVSPQGQTMLVDAGGPIGITGSVRGATAGFDIGEEVVSPYLWSRRLRRLDVAVLTHAHSDHMGGMPAVLRNLRPRELWVSMDPASEGYRTLLREAAELNIAVHHWRAGDAVDWSGIHVDVLAPEAAYTNAGSAANNDSLVLLLQYGRASALLEGDAEAPSEEAMVRNHRLSPVTLLKVGHHGSLTSSNPEFLHAVTPREAVISVGRFNTFGHPRAEVIQGLAAEGTKVFRTDEAGQTSFLLTSDGRIDVRTNASN